MNGTDQSKTSFNKARPHCPVHREGAYPGAQRDAASERGTLVSCQLPSFLGDLPKGAQ